MNTSAVIAGQIRDPLVFKKNISLLNKIKSEGRISRIVFSSWHEELEKYEGIRGFLKAENILTVTSRCPELLLDYQTDPPAPKYVTILQQIKSLRLGIECCDDDDWVLRLRSDIPISENTVRVLTPKAEDVELNPLVGWPKVFSKKIAVLGGICFYPFFINDMLFAGAKCDLRKLATPQITTQLFGLRMNCEQQLFTPPFWDFLPIAPLFFQSNPGLESRSRELSLSVLWRSVEFPFYRRVLGAFYNVLLNYFLVNGGSDSRTDEDVSRTIKETNLSFAQLISETRTESFAGIGWFSSIHNHTFDSLQWIRLLLDGRFSSSGLGDSLISAIQETREPCSQIPYENWMVHAPEDASDYRNSLLDLRPELSFIAMDFPVKNENEITIVGRPIQASLLR
jgi:hypothetical protein